jgi:O-antigen/teichoic acid export membrane protein
MASSLAKNSVLTLQANMLLAASNWLLLVVFAKEFSAQSLGEFVLALAICSPAFLFASFKIRTLLIVDSSWEYSLEEYAASRFVANALVSVFILISLVFSLLAISPSTLILVLLYKWCDSWSEFCQSYMRRLHRFQLSSFSLTGRSVLTILVVLLLVALDQSFITLLCTWVAVALIFALIDSAIMWQLSGKNEVRSFSLPIVFSLHTLRRSFTFYYAYLTVACALVISSLFVHLPNILIGYQMDVSSVGVFATISYFLVAGGILINSLSQAATPQLSRHLKHGDFSLFQRLVKLLCLLGLIIGITGIAISWFFGHFFLNAFYNSRIAEHYMVLNWVMCAACVRYIYIFLGTSLGAVKAFHIQTKIYAAGLFAMAVVGYLLIDLNGILGAAQAMLVATILELVLFLAFTQSHLKRAFSRNEALQ